MPARKDPTKVQLDEIATLLELGTPVREICDIIGIGNKTWYRWCERDPSFDAFVKKFQANHKLGIRQSLKRLTNKDNPQAVIHQSKAILGNTEKQELTINPEKLSDDDLKAEVAKILTKLKETSHDREENTEAGSTPATDQDSHDERS